MEQQNDRDSTANYIAAEDDIPTSKRRKRVHAFDDLLAREVGIMREGAGNSSPSFVGSASGIHFIRTVYGALGSTNIESTSPEAHLVPGEDDRLVSAAEQIPGAEKQIWTSQEVETANSASLTVTFDDLVACTSSFFDNWHPAFPFLHAPSVLTTFERLSADMSEKSLDQWSQMAIVKAIVSLSLADRRQINALSVKPVSRLIVFTTFEAAIESVQPALSRPVTIDGLQAVLAVQLFLVSMLRLNAAARLGGLIAQMAYQLGLHRCPVRYESFSVEDCQLRKRILWSMYCIERYLCQALGLPLSIRDEDVDVCHLNTERHYAGVQRASSSTDSHKHHGFNMFDQRLQLLCFLAQHAQLRGSIIELRNKRVEERDRSPDTATLINAKLTQWWNEVEDFLDQYEDESSQSLSILHKSILETLRYESVILLYRPLLALPKDNANYTGAVHACIGAAKALINALHNLLKSLSTEESHGPGVPMMWPSFTWATWMSAFILLYGATEDKVSTQVVSRSVDKALQILERLALRGNVWPKACAVAIQDLKATLTREHQFEGVCVSLPSDRAGVQADAPSSTSKRSQTNVGQSNANLTYHGQQSHRDAECVHNRHAVQATGHRASDLQESQAFAGSTRNSTGADARTASSTLLTANNDANYGYSHPQQPEPCYPLDDNALPDTALLPRDVPLMAFGGLDPFQGFDIPFWVGQDNYMAWMENNA